MLNFKTWKVHHQCDKVLDNIKWRKLIFCFLQPLHMWKLKPWAYPNTQQCKKKTQPLWFSFSWIVSILASLTIANVQFSIFTIFEHYFTIKCPNVKKACSSLAFLSFCILKAVRPSVIYLPLPYKHFLFINTSLLS